MVRIKQKFVKLSQHIEISAEIPTGFEDVLAEFAKDYENKYIRSETTTVQMYGLREPTLRPGKCFR